MRTIATLAAPLVLIAAASSAQTPTAAPAPTTAAPVKDRIVCKSSDTLGSRLKVTKICHTQSEWRQMARDQSDNMDARLRTVHQEAGGG